MIFYITGLLIIIFGFYNYKKGFMFYLAYKLILVQNITLVSIPGIPLLTLDMAMNLFFVVMFFLNKSKHQHAHTKFPYKIPFICLFVSWTLSAFCGIAGFSSELSNLVKVVLEDILLIWMMWQILETREDFETLYKYISIIMFVSCVYAFVELVLGDNPLLMYEAKFNNDSSRTVDMSYSSEERGYRVRSIYEHAIGAGINWSMYFSLTLRKWLDNGRKKMSKFYLITAALCVPCVILTRMRSCLLFLLISCLMLVDLKKKKFLGLIIIGLIGIVILSPLIESNINIFLSFFNKDAATAVGGSDLQLRVMQYTSALELVRKSPIFGLGIKFQKVLSNVLVKRLAGLEGLWLSVILWYGYFGIIVYLIYALYSLVIIPYKFSSKPLFFISLAYWIVYTASSVPGMKLYLYFLIVIYFIKSSNVYQISKKNGIVYGVYLDNGMIRYGAIKNE